MKKMLSLSLSLILLLTLLPSAALAAETFTTGEAGIELIKEYEGFRDMPYTDSRGDWYIGYGSSCDPEDYPDGITEEEADELLREQLESKEDAVNRLLLDYGIDVEQQQFDAMVSMTYTLGTQWMNPNYRFCAYLIDGIWKYTEAEVVNAIATWCHQGDRVLDNLVERRLREAFLFLYGEYDNEGPDSYCYIHFEPEGGTVENSTVFFPVGLPYGSLPEPEAKGRRFLGWYTEDGEPFDEMSEAWEDQTLIARWDGETTGPSKEEIDYSKWVNPYSDVKDTDWYFAYVRELSAKGIMGGYPDGTFLAENTLTAGEALKLILLAADYPEQEPLNWHWASGYLALAEETGCLAVGEVTDLDAPMSRGLIAQVAAVALGIDPSSAVTPFADADDGYLTALYEERILNGTVMGSSRLYYPQDGIKRSEVCAIVSRIGSWEESPKNDPAETGYVAYRNKYYPLHEDVPACAYEPNLFVKDGSTMYYNDPSYTTALGIDVSSHQGEIDWGKVASSGVEFAMIRLGFRGYGQEGTINLDKYFLQNIRGAADAGLKVGVYFFSQAITPEEAEEEALFVLDNLDQAGVYLDYPVVYDWEPVSDSGARTNGLDVITLTDCAITFCQAVEEEGYIPMVYYNTPVGYTRYDLSRLTDYDVWYAQYAQWPTMYYDYRIWQYTDSGKIPGISTRVDMNIAFLPY